MIHTEDGELLAQCDGKNCNETEWAGNKRLTFKAFVQELKGRGWLVRKRDGFWEHLCRVCAEVEG